MPKFNVKQTRKNKKNRDLASVVYIVVVVGNRYELSIEKFPFYIRLPLPFIVDDRIMPIWFLRLSDRWASNF
jgi:hypothetical protein